MYLTAATGGYAWGDMSIALVGDKKEIPCYQLNAYLFDIKKNISGEFQSLEETTISKWLTEQLSKEYGKNNPYLKEKINNYAEKFGEMAARVMKGFPYALSSIDNEDYNSLVGVSIVASNEGDIPGYRIIIDLVDQKKVMEEEFQSLEDTFILDWAKKNLSDLSPDMLDALMIDIQWATKVASSYQLMAR